MNRFFPEREGSLGQEKFEYIIDQGGKIYFWRGTGLPGSPPLNSPPRVTGYAHGRYHEGKLVVSSDSIVKGANRPTRGALVMTNVPLFTPPLKVVEIIDDDDDEGSAESSEESD